MSSQVSPDLPRTDDLLPVRPWLLRILRPLFEFGFRRWWKITLHGTEHLPIDGPAILAPNHIGVIDGPLLIAVIKRDSYALAKHELFTGFVGRMLLLIGQVPIDRWHIDTYALRRCVRLIRDGQLLIIYPEGYRGPGELTHAKNGLAYLALVTGVPIVPVALLGTREPGQTTSQLPHRGAPIHVVYGEPFSLAKQPWPRRKDDVADWTEHIRIKLAAHVQEAQKVAGLPLPGPPKPKGGDPDDSPPPE